MLSGSVPATMEDLDLAEGLFGAGGGGGGGGGGRAAATAAAAASYRISCQLPEEGSGTDDSTSDDPSPQTPNRRSKVWEYFEKDLVEVGGVLKAVCKYCRLPMTSSKKTGTNSLRNHIAEHCPKITEADRERFIATMKRQPTEGSFVFDHQKSRELMVKWCISAEIPFNKFEDPYFAPWIESMQPTFNPGGRQTIRNASVGSYEKEVQMLRNEMQNLDSRICFTSDLWTSNQQLGYICITTHYVDSNFVLKKKIIGFRDVKYPHTGLAIEEAITKCFSEWGIKSKMFTITLDNASNNMTACGLLRENGETELLFGGEHILVRCCAHILNIIVQDGVAIAQKAIELIRDLIRHINSSPSRIQAFNELTVRAGLPSKAGLLLDIPNRWNSTHDMILEAIKYKVVLKRYADAQLEPTPTETEWSNAEAIGKFLGAFEEATKAFSADRSPTSHLFLENLLCIHHALANREWQVNDVLNDLASAMIDKFKKYWDGKYNLALVIATVLDPTKKMDFIDFFYEKVCPSYEDYEASMELAKTWLTKYFEEYERLSRRRNRGNPRPRESATRSVVGSPVLGKTRVQEEFAEFRCVRRGSRVLRSELDAYLEEEHVRKDEKFEILTWWKTNANKYPVLSTMARDFLAIPLSTVSSESAFSCGGRILGDTRSSMTPKTLEALVCGKDWLYQYPNNEVKKAHDHCCDDWEDEDVE
ncbi:hypothetical protein ACP4OV_020760 [Aristida adscensionis]